MEKTAKKLSSLALCLAILAISLPVFECTSFDTIAQAEKYCPAANTLISNWGDRNNPHSAGVTIAGKGGIVFHSKEVVAPAQPDANGYMSGVTFRNAGILFFGH